jgi:predicted dehydrogenase
MKEVKWGIIGAGKIARKFAHDFQFTKNGILYAVASRSTEKAQVFASEFQITKTFGSYHDLFNDPEVDALYIATPHNFHFENSMEALQSGKAVLCEKPITIGLQEWEQLEETAKTSGRFLMEAMWSYFLPTIRKAQEWIDSGRIGKILHLKCDFGFPAKYDPKGRLFNPALAGGSLYDIGIYPLAMAQLFLGKDYQALDVHVKKAPTGVDDDLIMILDYPGATATLASSFRCKLPNCAFIIGEKGMIKIPDFWKSEDCYLYDHEKEIEHFHDGRKGFGYEFEIQAATDSILAGEQASDTMPWVYSRNLQEMMEEVRQYF